MPSKGSSRRHEAIRVVPAGPVPTVTPGPAASADGPSGPWAEPEPAEAATAGDAPAQQVEHSYVGEDGTWVMLPADVRDLRARAQQEPGAPVALDWSSVALSPQATGEHVSLEGPASVTSPDGISSRYEVDGQGLSCAAHPGQDCAHRAAAVDAIQAVMEGRRPATDAADWEANTETAAAALAQDHQRSEAARAAPPPTPPTPSAWAEDPSAFQAAYEAARARHAAGEPAVPFRVSDATGGLGARDGGRGFGIELEFDLGPDVVNRQAAIAAIGRDLHAAGLTATPERQGYHSNVGSPHWRFEYDSTVDGEVVSPVLYDEPRSWDQLRQACEIIRRHGGRATAHTGGHVHVSVSDFDHTVENHNNLLGLVRQHEDVIYRLAQQPGARAHRGQHWCSPNQLPAAGYRDIHHVQANNAGHHVGVNFGAVRGQHSDHVEFRMWDGSLDPGTIQAQVNLSLGITDAAFRSERGTVWGHEPIGAHRQRHTGGNLTGERWRDATTSFRRLVDRALPSDANRAQAAALFAVTRWQRPNNGAWRRPRTQ